MFNLFPSRKFIAVPALAAALLIALPASAQSVEGFSPGGYSYPALRVDGAPLLKSFYFRYSSDDHHIQSIAMQPHKPQLGKATVAFGDNNNDDDYYYKGEFAPYYGTIWRREVPLTVCTGSCFIPLQRPADPQNWAFVITGFRVFFRGDDHHIDQLRVTESNGYVTVAYNDKNDDDSFAWELQYAYVPRSRFTSLGSRTGSAKGAQGVDYLVGNGVLRGFNFDFASEDHHIKDLGVMLRNNGRLEVYYGDHNVDDSFSWQVDYGILN